MTAPSPVRRLAVVGGGWAGLSAAVAAVQQGWSVTLYEMARHAGGRARTVAASGLDNGQHILIGAYRDTLALMRTVGADPDQLLLRHPLALCMADGRGLRLRPGAPAWAFVSAVLRADGWTLAEKLALLRACAGWAAGGFRCQPDRSVDELCRTLPASVRQRLIDPLCVAALNTPAREASAAVFLRVLHDGLFGGRGGCDLLLPRQPLGALLPEPALAWLAARGADIRLGHRVSSIAPGSPGWLVDGQAYDHIVLACSATECARLLMPIDPGWSAAATALRFEPIVTVYLHCPGARLPLPMVALQEDAQAPAQFVFDHGQLAGAAGRFAFVISGAAPWVEAGLDATARAVRMQAAHQLAACNWGDDRTQVVDVIAERRATFRCTPALSRPSMAVAPGLAVAGDHVQGPYPATLEGAVRSGIDAVRHLASTMQNRVSPATRPS